jgi:hypothetical protein
MKIKPYTNISLDIIATYGSFRDFQQEHFQLNFLSKAKLKSEKALIAFIKKQLIYPNDLFKLSLCFICSDKELKKYPIVKKIIDEKNGKYLFIN